MAKKKKFWAFIFAARLEESESIFLWVLLLLTYIYLVLRVLKFLEKTMCLSSNTDTIETEIKLTYSTHTLFVWFGKSLVLEKHEKYNFENKDVIGQSYKQFITDINSHMF